MVVITGQGQCQGQGQGQGLELLVQGQGLKLLVQGQDSKDMRERRGGELQKRLVEGDCGRFRVEVEGMEGEMHDL